VKSGALQRNPEQTRAWLDKHRGSFGARGGLQRRGAGPARAKPKAPDPIPPETRRAARARSGGKCVVCAHRGYGGRGGRKAAHLHHVFPKQANRWPELIAVEDNLVGVCFDCHEAHEGGSERIPLGALPECVFRLAADVGKAAVDYLLGPTYGREPARGGTAHDGRRRDGE
jgi:hypothetical protein